MFYSDVHASRIEEHFRKTVDKQITSGWLLVSFFAGFWPSQGQMVGFEEHSATSALAVGWLLDVKWLCYYERLEIWRILNESQKWLLILGAS